MQLILDHLTSVIVSAVVLLAGLTMLGVANRAGVRVSMSQGATGNHLWITEVLDQDMVNLGAMPFNPYLAVQSYASYPDSGHLQFLAPIEPDSAVQQVRWVWRKTGEVEIDSARVRITVPRYDVFRYTGDGTNFSSSSRGWAARFSLRLLDGGGLPVTEDSLTRRVQVHVMTLARRWGDDPPYRVQNDYRATYYPMNLHK
jgi:hypothetical protein